LNATEAARRAGNKCNDGTLAAIGSRNTRKHKIISKIDKGQAKLAMLRDEIQVEQERLSGT